MYYKFSIHIALFLHAAVATVFQRRIWVLVYTARRNSPNFSQL